MDRMHRINSVNDFLLKWIKNTVKHFVEIIND